jgi:hypothetical protein
MTVRAFSFAALPRRVVRLFFIGMLSLLMALLAFRMTLGVDLGDESYYIAFVDGWLKTGLAGGKALGVHQTAALLVYPAVKLFASLHGSVEGLALFLRAVYLAGSVAAALCFYRFVRELHGTAVSVLSAVLITCFIPFSLPSPSYNTIGMLAMIAALSGCGTLFLQPPRVPRSGRYRWKWALASACAWTVAVIAYPTLLAVQFLLLFCLLCIPPNSGRGEVWRYVFLCAACQAAGACALLGVYGLDRLREMLHFSNASLQISSGLGAKIKLLVTPLWLRPGFGFLCAGAAALGASGTWLSRSVSGRFALALLTTGLLAASSVLGPALFAQSHDYVLLLAIAGAVRWLLPWKRQEETHARLLRTLAAVGLFAGLITSATATNGLVNFAVGGFFLAAFGLAFAMRAEERRSTLTHIAALIAVIGFFLWSAFAFVYGEGHNPLQGDLKRIESGVFAGLMTRSGNAEAIDATSQLLAETARSSHSIAVFGRLPGIYLLTTMEPMALSTWDFSQQSGPLPAIEKLRSEFYATPAYQPDVIALVNDPWTKPPSDASLQLLASYSPCTTGRYKPWTIDLYVKRTAMPSSNCRN